MAVPFSKFYGKIWVSFCLNTGKRFFLEVSISSQQKEHRFFCKTVLGIFKIALRLRDRYGFMWRSVKILNIFSTLTLKQFSRKLPFFKKLKYHLLVECIKIEKASFPYKTVISEANVETNGIVTTKWVYHRGLSFASNYFIFFKVLFQFKNLF